MKFLGIVLLLISLYNNFLNRVASLRSEFFYNQADFNFYAQFCHYAERPCVLHFVK
jgi:hypothetical protein